MEVIVEKTDGKAVIHLDGRFDIKSTFAFRTATRPLLEDAGIGTLEVNFAKASFVDSSALGMLLLLREYAQASRKEVVLSHCSRELHKVLSIAQFHQLFRIE